MSEKTGWRVGPEEGVSSRPQEALPDWVPIISDLPPFAFGEVVAMACDTATANKICASVTNHNATSPSLGERDHDGHQVPMTYALAKSRIICALHEFDAIAEGTDLGKIAHEIILALEAAGRALYACDGEGKTAAEPVAWLIGGENEGRGAFVTMGKAVVEVAKCRDLSIVPLFPHPLYASPASAEMFERPEEWRKAAGGPRMDGPMVHDLKCAAGYYEEVHLGRKTAELRIADRDFRMFDILRLHELEYGKLTGRTLDRQITHIVWDSNGPWLAPGYCMLSLSPVSAGEGEIVEALREARGMLRSCDFTADDDEIDPDLKASWDRGLAKIDAALSKREAKP